MRGGLHLLAHKHRATAAPVACASVPTRLSLILAAAETAPCVAVDERVLLGQPIATHKKLSLHAPASGIITALTVQNKTLTIAIDNDERDTHHPALAPIDAYRDMTAAELRAAIARAGIVGLGGATFSTAAKLIAAADRAIPLLIVNGAECEPYITCDEVLMRERASEILLGTQALLHAGGATRAIIAIENNKPESIAALQDANKKINDARIAIESVATFYPAGGERQLIKTLTGREVPCGQIPPDIGVLCQNVGTAIAVAQLIKTGEPLICRVVTVTGSGVRQPRNLIARFGTPIASLIADCGGYSDNVERLIMGGTMMGVALDSDEMTVGAATNCIIAATAEDLKSRGPEMPCIRCGECAYACPANLLPQQLLRYARLNDRAVLNELGLADCIECGCCDYVCPSQIPLTANFVTAKHR